MGTSQCWGVDVLSQKIDEPIPRPHEGNSPRGAASALEPWQSPGISADAITRMCGTCCQTAIHDVFVEERAQYIAAPYWCWRQVARWTPRVAVVDGWGTPRLWPWCPWAPVDTGMGTMETDWWWRHERMDSESQDMCYPAACSEDRMAWVPLWLHQWDHWPGMATRLPLACWQWFCGGQGTGRLSCLRSGFQKQNGMVCPCLSHTPKTGSWTLGDWWYQVWCVWTWIQEHGKTAYASEKQRKMLSQAHTGQEGVSTSATRHWQPQWAQRWTDAYPGPPKCRAMWGGISTRGPPGGPRLWWCLPWGRAWLLFGDEAWDHTGRRPGTDQTVCNGQHLQLQQVEEDYALHLGGAGEGGSTSRMADRTGSGWTHCKDGGTEISSNLVLYHGQDQGASWRWGNQRSCLELLCHSYRTLEVVQAELHTPVWMQHAHLASSFFRREERRWFAGAPATAESASRLRDAHPVGGRDLWWGGRQFGMST